ncbi:MFS transporter [Allorhizocola rhizosphaerae]|uniref:MFS transporter n=1 Tax=Allorhizocola rhizosphaerae TaxID=1872709 RepID=UPI000E3BF8F8|nr:MFS transporter [Allorhizocola rhizosphaerae]
MPHPVSTSSSASSDPPERPATFRDVFANGEYRAVFSATVLSWVGDYLAKIAVTVLVFQQTGSAGVAAATFAISYAPWLLIGPVLTALAERMPRRTVMIISDIARMIFIGLVALVDMPVPLMIVLLFLTALGNPPYDAARSALTATLLPGDKLVVGLAFAASAGQAAQIGGYLGGGLLAAVDPHLALLIDAATFAISALLIGLFVKRRPPVERGARQNLLRETIDGFRMVFGTPALRGIAVVIFGVMLFSTLPEGLGVIWTDALRPPDDRTRGLTQGLIMLVPALGFIVGGLLVGRLVRPDTRNRLIRPLAVLTPLVLVPALLNPPLWAVCLMGFLCGASVAGILPAANGLFVQALPNTHRSRAFGVMQSGMQLLQGGSIFIVGLLARPASMLPTVVGLWCLAGVGLMLVVALLVWPAQERFTAAIERARQINQASAA